MGKTILSISSILFATLAIWLSYDLLRPARTSTYALNERITLLPEAKKYFQTDFDYNYGIEVRLESGSNLKKGERLDFQIIDNETGFMEILSGTIDESESVIHLGNFNASSGDHFELIVNYLSPGLKGVNAILKIDVTGGGPSVGLALLKYLKPYFWVIVVFFGFMAVITGYLGFKTN